MSLALDILFGLVAGALIAVAHVRTLAPGVSWLTAGRTGSAIALLIGRMVALAAALLGLALLGRGVLLGGVIGLLVARAVLIHKATGERA